MFSYILIGYQKPEDQRQSKVNWITQYVWHNGHSMRFYSTINIQLPWTRNETTMIINIITNENRISRTKIENGEPH